jgi:hypothetical protein
VKVTRNAPATVPRSGAPPTKYACAAAWDRSVPFAALAWDRRQHVWQATVQEDSVRRVRDSWTNKGKVTTTNLGTVQACQVMLFAPNGGAMMVTGTWRGGTVPSWTPPQHVPPELPNGDGGNACVAPDGTLHDIGPFTAGSRCPRSS